MWQGSYKNVEMPWLRWYDKDGNWILTSTEQERQKAEQKDKSSEQERQKTRKINCPTACAWC